MAVRSYASALRGGHSSDRLKRSVFHSMPQKKFIFDLDGTLYRFKGGTTFATSNFYTDIKQNIFRFLIRELSIPSDQAQELYDRLKRQYKGDISIGVEKEFGIDRARYFAETWNVSPEKYIEPSDSVRALFSALSGRCAILTGAPRVWAEAALRFLNVYEFVEDSLFTGEPDIRKPSVEAFRRVGEFLDVTFDSIYSVGDQEESDILTAKSLGMRAIRVGSSETSADAHIHTLIDLLTLSIDGESIV